MIEPQKRVAVITLHRQGRSPGEIARLLAIDIKTVKRIIENGPEAVREARSDKIVLDEKTLREIAKKASGYTVRIKEILEEERGIRIGYSTLTQKLRELGLSRKSPPRSCMEPDIPGKEAQHDTSTYKVTIAGQTVKVICSCLYLRYSKVCYIRFYRSFDRFAMQCFFDEAIRYWGYSASTVIIDNTHLAVWYGSGSKAVFIPEMVSFAKRYGFTWLAHAINHPNRKSGVESFFRLIGTNFIPGREFSSLEDMNQQAFDWVTDRYAKKPKAKTGLIPIVTFEQEKAYLIQLPDYVSYPSRPHARLLDQYGYCAFKANYYWVPEYAPGTKEKIHRVKIIEFAKYIVIYRLAKMVQLVRYDLPKDGVKNQRFAPDGVSLRYKPRHRKRSGREEEKHLRAMGQALNNYIDFIYSPECHLTQKQHFIRRLHHLSSKIASPIFLKAIDRALAHHVYSIQAIGRIVSQLLKISDSKSTPPDLSIDNDYVDRETYLKGRFCDEQDLDNLDLFDDASADEQDGGQE